MSKLLAGIFNKLRPHFEKGGRWERLYPLFEAKEAFLFTSAIPTDSGCHIRDRMDTKRLMSFVILALLPPLFLGTYNVGYQHFLSQGKHDVNWIECTRFGAHYVIPIILVSYTAGGIWEVLFAVIRKHEINEGFLVTGLLVPMIVPPTIPLWQVAIAVSFAVVIGKEIFGGTGMNIFNPALTARAFLFFNWAAFMSGDKVWSVTNEKTIDAYSGATPLLVASKHELTDVVTALEQFGQQNQLADYSVWNCMLGFIPGSIGETSFIAIMIGAAFLIITGVGSWQIILSSFLGGIATALAMNQLAPNSASLFALPWYYHIVTGGFAFGAVYMATDPVSAAQTPLGKWIYGLLIGVLAILLRTVNPAFPEAMMLAILFMNVFAPLIDYFVLQTHMKKRLKRAYA